MFKSISYIKYRVILLNLGLFFCCFPYFAPFPLNNDIQYPIFLVCLLIIVDDILSKKFYLSKIEIILLIFSLLSFIYINLSQDVNYQIQKRAAPLAGFFIFYVFSRNIDLIKYELLTIFIFINFILALLNLLFIKYFIFLFLPFVRTIKFSGFDDRGASGLMAEPSFLGAMGIFFY